MIISQENMVDKMRDTTQVFYISIYAEVSFLSFKYIYTAPRNRLYGLYRDITFDKATREIKYYHV